MGPPAGKGRWGGGGGAGVKRGAFPRRPGRGGLVGGWKKSAARGGTERSRSPQRVPSGPAFPLPVKARSGALLRSPQPGASACGDTAGLLKRTLARCHFTSLFLLSLVLPPAPKSLCRLRCASAALRSSVCTKPLEGFVPQVLALFLCVFPFARGSALSSALSPAQLTEQRRAVA